MRLGQVLFSSGLAGAITLTLPQGFEITESMLAQAEAQYGHDARARVENWRQLIQANQHLPVQEKLSITNDFFNRLRFVDDSIHWSQQDYWATPLEMLASGGGDCEDFAIAKYFTLKTLNVPEERLRLTYVKALRLNQAHMVLTYFASPDAEPLVLDNLTARIQPARQRVDLIPVYSFNGEGLWLAKKRGVGQHVGGAERVGLWQDLLGRMRYEGLKK